MKKLFFLIPATLILSCSSDSDEIKKEIQEENENNQPTITVQSFTADEHSEAGTSIGSISASDSDNDELTFTINSESGLEINEELVMTDRGLSAFHAEHKSKGALGVFLKLVEEDKIKPGSVLIVESLDR